MLFGNKSQPLLGLDITTSSVKLIELSQSGKRYRVESYSAEPTPPSSVSEKAIVDAKAVGEAIRRAVKRAGAKATDVAVAISGDAAITKVIQMPSSLSERDLEGQVEIDSSMVLRDQVADPAPAGERIPPHRGAQQDVALPHGGEHLHPRLPNRLADLGGHGDHLHAGLAVSMLEQELARCAEDRFPLGPGLGPARVPSWSCLGHASLPHGFPHDFFGLLGQ